MCVACKTCLLALLQQFTIASQPNSLVYLFLIFVVVVVVVRDTVIGSVDYVYGPLFALNFVFLSPLHQLAHTHTALVVWNFILFFFQTEKTRSVLCLADFAPMFTAPMFGQFVIVSLVWCCGFCGIHFSVSRIWCEFFNYLPVNTKIITYVANDRTHIFTIHTCCSTEQYSTAAITWASNAPIKITHQSTCSLTPPHTNNIYVSFAATTITTKKNNKSVYAAEKHSHLPHYPANRSCNLYFRHCAMDRKIS